eukprot:CAMPEP_0172500026 /NCGR_PEP_ID=MMETSP1066-20121228/133618_1 /TAXON_ID=671091 /ORGANISM="Coscinodiscus wailesii, Strain CCMP2513" /LENGTH=512 /DNA_ID=CAMNT_0013274073 /DNA_START=72 /DNA_END=1607 /DNA_ORIENTATION=+
MTRNNGISLHDLQNQFQIIQQQFNQMNRNYDTAMAMSTPSTTKTLQGKIDHDEFGRISPRTVICFEDNISGEKSVADNEAYEDRNDSINKAHVFSFGRHFLYDETSRDDGSPCDDDNVRGDAVFEDEESVCTVTVYSESSSSSLEEFDAKTSGSDDFSEASYYFMMHNDDDSISSYDVDNERKIEKAVSFSSSNDGRSRDGCRWGDDDNDATEDESVCSVTICSESCPLGEDDDDTETKSGVFSEASHYFMMPHDVGANDRDDDEEEKIIEMSISTTSCTYYHYPSWEYLSRDDKEGQIRNVFNNQSLGQCDDGVITVSFSNPLSDSSYDVEEAESRITNSRSMANSSRHFICDDGKENYVFLTKDEGTGMGDNFIHACDDAVEPNLMMKCEDIGIDGKDTSVCLLKNEVMRYDSIHILNDIHDDSFDCGHAREECVNNPVSDSKHETKLETANNLSNDDNSDGMFRIVILDDDSDDDDENDNDSLLLNDNDNGRRSRYCLMNVPMSVKHIW